MRALAALRMVWASAVWMAVEMLATWCVRKLRGDARPSPYRVLSVVVRGKKSEKKLTFDRLIVCFQTGKSS